MASSWWSALFMLLRPGQADRHGPVLPSSGAALESRGQPASLAVEDWEIGMGKRVDSVHKLQESSWVQNSQAVTWAGEP